MTHARHSRRQSPQFEPLEGIIIEEATVESGALISEKVRTDLGAHALGGSLDQIHDGEKKGRIDRAATMRELYSRSGFYARDTVEEASMHAILEHTGAPFENPVADYLFDVSRKQDSLGEKDPFAAPRSIVHQFEEHAVMGDREAKIARLFLRTLHDRGVESEQLFSEVFTPDYLLYDESSLRTLTSVVRRIEDEAYAFEGIGKYPLSIRNGIDALKHNERYHRVYDVLESMPIESVVTYVNQVRIEENRRYEYWMKQLIQAKKWEPVKLQAASSIAKLNERR